MEFDLPPYRIRINVPDGRALLDQVAARLRAGQGFALATMNLDHLTRLTRDPAFRVTYAAQDLVTADGNPVVWLSRIAGRPVSLVAGSDMTLPLFRTAADCGVPVALIGTTPAALDTAAARLRAQIPGLSIAFAESPPMGFDPEGDAARDLIARLGRSGARMAFLALGSPRQERLAALGRGMLPGMGFASVGAGLDFVAGTQVRAPRWMRALALEWLWRLLTAPRRLAGRYASNIAVLPGLVLAAWRMRRR